MSPITQLSAPSDYPEAMDALDPAEHAFLLAVRWWVAARQQDGDPLLRLCAALKGVGATTAAFALDRFMTLAAHSTRRRVVMYCPYSPQLGEDEKHLLYSVNLVQYGQSELASQVLRASILTIEGAVLALGPLEEVAEEFGKLKLHFRQRKMPAAEIAFPATIESWITSLSGTTLH
jgi:hypothetical protein